MLTIKLINANSTLSKNNKIIHVIILKEKVTL